MRSSLPLFLLLAVVTTATGVLDTRRPASGLRVPRRPYPLRAAASPTTPLGAPLRARRSAVHPRAGDAWLPGSATLLPAAAAGAGLLLLLVAGAVARSDALVWWWWGAKHGLGAPTVASLPPPWAATPFSAEYRWALLSTA
eukprot:EG_transcript_44836